MLCLGAESEKVQRPTPPRFCGFYRRGRNGQHGTIGTLDVDLAKHAVHGADNSAFSSKGLAASLRSAIRKRREK